MTWIKSDLKSEKKLIDEIKKLFTKEFISKKNLLKKIYQKKLNS
jgi:hypothetical protein